MRFFHIKVINAIRKNKHWIVIYRKQIYRFEYICLIWKLNSLQFALTLLQSNKIIQYNQIECTDFLQFLKVLVFLDNVWKWTSYLPQHVDLAVKYWRKILWTACYNRIVTPFAVFYVFFWKALNLNFIVTYNFY